MNKSEENNEKLKFEKIRKIIRKGAGWGIVISFLILILMIIDLLIAVLK